MDTKAAVRATDPATSAAIAVATALAWLGMLLWVDGGRAFGTYVAAWTVMMVAMMLPSAAPFVLLYRKGSSPAATARLVAGYLSIWAATGVGVWSSRDVAMQVPAWTVLAAAGVYQLSPAKQACLGRCRSAADFLAQYWHASAVRLGAHHGLYCLGCCWALMAVLIVAGMMAIAWVAVITVIVAAEKLLPGGERFARSAGVGLLVASLLEGTGWM